MFDLGDGTVLRRYRERRASTDVGLETRAMQWAGEHGVRVPVVVRAAPGEFVMERIDGPTMLDDLGRRPWMIIGHALLLARLGRRIAAVPAPEWLPPIVDGADPDALVHGDLHPMNVIVSPQGPVVIDWTNAATGPTGFDAAACYVLMATVEIDGVVDRLGRRVFTAVFALASGRPQLRRHLHAACTRRLADPGATPAELVAVRRLQRRAARTVSRRRRGP